MEEIKSVKIQGQGYLLNGTMSVPKADGNREYELIKEWLAQGNVPESEFTEEELEAQALAKSKAEAQSYLNSTDWINSKYMDVVVVLATMTKEEFLAKYSDVYLKRELARQIINGESV